MSTDMWKKIDLAVGIILAALQAAAVIFIPSLMMLALYIMAGGSIH